MLALCIYAAFYRLIGCTAVSWCRSLNGRFRLQLVLPPNEASDRLNFVLKDAATNTWYDHNGTNFVAPLRADVSAVSDDSTLPQLPVDLCNVWAWIKWDQVRWYHALQPHLRLRCIATALRYLSRPPM